MVCRGIVKQGKVELEPGVQLPEGTKVRIEPITPDWLEELDRLAIQVAEASKDSPSILDTLSEMRR